MKGGKGGSVRVGRGSRATAPNQRQCTAHPAACRDCNHTRTTRHWHQYQPLTTTTAQVQGKWKHAHLAPIGLPDSLLALLLPALPPRREGCVSVSDPEPTSLSSIEVPMGEVEASEACSLPACAWVCTLGSELPMAMEEPRPARRAADERRSVLSRNDDVAVELEPWHARRQRRPDVSSLGPRGHFS